MKIKISNLNRLIEELTGREIDFLLYLIKRQNDIGQVGGVFYKDVMDDLHLPRSTFYRALDNLQTKGFVSVDWFERGKGFSIIVSDNSFTCPRDYKEGYLNINLDYILSEEFISMHVNLKKFFLRMLSLQADKREVKILKDTLRRYKILIGMKGLGDLFNMIECEGGYMISIHFGITKRTNNVYYEQYLHKLKNYCKVYNIDYDFSDLRDSVKTIVNIIRRNKFALLQKAFDAIRSIGRLQPKLITHICYR